jgi:polar amino acid transport system substrate-binding protein
MRRRSFLALSFALSGLSRALETAGRAAPPAPLVVGMELAYPPFEMADTDGKPSGVSVDLAQALGEHLHRPIQIQNMPFDGLIPSLKTGRIDLILSSMTATAERARAVTFSDPYLTTGLCLLVGKSAPLQSIEDADQKNRVIAVKQGTTGHLYARNFKNAKVLVLDREAACVLEVTQAKADAFLYDQLSVLKHAEQNPNTTRALLRPFQIESWAIAVRKGNDALRDAINDFLRQFRASGGFDRLADRWLQEPKKAFQRLGVPFVF